MQGNLFFFFFFLVQFIVWDGVQHTCPVEVPCAMNSRDCWHTAQGGQNSAARHDPHVPSSSAYVLFMLTRIWQMMMIPTGPSMERKQMGQLGDSGMRFEAFHCRPTLHGPHSKTSQQIPLSSRQLITLDR
jgi:hypothetical protein